MAGGLGRSVRSLPPLSETEKADLAETEKSLALLEAAQAASHSSRARGVSVHKTSVGSSGNELKVLAAATHVLLNETEITAVKINPLTCTLR